ncbi:hypothetical protein [Albidovulum inexpectatum]|nr:hypothetical protein [Albidovulum inexpectatum]
MALTNNDARIVMGMILRGDKQHDIAAWFGENQARIVEVEKGAFGNVTPAPEHELPPRGAPGPKGRRLRGYVRKAIQALDANDPAAARQALVDGLAAYDRNEA